MLCRCETVALHHVELIDVCRLKLQLQREQVLLEYCLGVLVVKENKVAPEGRAQRRRHQGRSGAEKTIYRPSCFLTGSIFRSTFRLIAHKARIQAGR